MYYDLSKLEKTYEVKLDETQKGVLSDLANFIESDEWEVCLSAKAGTGKSLILSMLYDIIKDNGYSCTFVTPTNKAKLALTSKGDSNRTSLTIHSLLCLRPNIEVMEFDASQLSFDFKYRTSKPHFDALLVDECSMINDDLYNVVLKEFRDSKIVWVGDPSQIAPIKQDHRSKTFEVRTLALTKIYRQPESKLCSILEQLRKAPLYHFDNTRDDFCNVIVCNNILNMINKYSYLFKVSKDFRDYNLVKLVTYTNNRIGALNGVIRNCLYTDHEEYHIGEVLTGYDTCDYSNVSHIDNSSDYIVTDIYPLVISCECLRLKAYKLRLKKEDESEFIITILSRNNPQYLLDNLAYRLEIKRQKAVKSKKPIDWAGFYKSYNSFLTPVNLSVDNRVIKRKSLDYGYCISVHKSQGSTYSIVLVDMENIWRCPNKEELRQMQYVACSRTASDLIIYQRDK